MTRPANLFGALALVAAGRMRDATETDLTTAAALVTMQTMTGGGSIDDLRRVLGLSHSGGVRLVRLLREAGLVEQRTDPADRRAAQLHLTPRGEDAATRIRAARLAALDDLLAPLAAPEREALAALLHRMLVPTATDRAAARHVCRLCDPDVCGHPDACPVTQGADAATSIVRSADL